MTDNKDVAGNRLRRLTYGANTLLLVVLGVVLLGVLGYVTTRWPSQMDMTTGGLFSLSGQTQKLLAEIDKGTKDYELVMLFPSQRAESTDDSRRIREQARQVEDLLKDFGRRSSRVKLTVPDSRDELLAMIKQRFSNESVGHEKLVKQFESELLPVMQKFLKDEAAELAVLRQNNKITPNTAKAAEYYEGLFGTALDDGLKDFRKEIRRMREESTPEWSTVTKSIKGAVEQVVSIVKVLAGDNIQQLRLPSDVAKHFAGRTAIYKEMIERLETFNAALDKLPPLKLEETLTQLTALGNGKVLVFGPGSVKTIEYAEMFKAQRGGNPDEKPRETFEGEQALASVLLSMARPEKSKIVFVGLTAGPQQRGLNLITGNYSEFAGRLRAANWEVSEWAPGAGENGAPTPPPAAGRNVVWVVFPPEPPNMQMMMMGMPPPDPTPLVDAVKMHVEAGGNVLFLAEANAGASAFNPGGGENFAFAEVIKPFGILVKANYTVVTAVPGRDGKRQASPQVMFRNYPKHPITDPLQALPGVFAGMGGQAGITGLPTMVMVDPGKPADAEATVIVETEQTRDVWADKEAPGPNMQFDSKDDVASPVPMAVVAERKGSSTQPGAAPVAQRIAVFGNKLALSNEVLAYTQMRQIGDMIAEVPVFPGNAELGVNTINWLGNYENMIAVSSKASVALRIRNMSDTEYNLIRWGVIFVGAPLLALVVGGVVYWRRRR